ncbi:MAG TPA: Holliday junction resolvase RuvX [Gammaproteobacteria bacterium]|nr:Holliday junction resolvase RuvX [Gammaproteobacteria bacterium]
MLNHPLSSGIFIGIDYGMRHIGYAIGQKSTHTATSGGVIRANLGVPDWHKLDNLLKEWQPEALILGWPLNMDGTLQDLTHKVEAFAEQLQARYHLPIHFMDERLTTKEARDHLFTEGGYRALTNKDVNARAAQIILENWLQTSV